MLDREKFKFHYKADMDEWTATHPDKPNRVWQVPAGFLGHDQDTWIQFIEIINECRTRKAVNILVDEPLPEFADPEILFDYRRKRAKEQGT